MGRSVARTCWSLLPVGEPVEVAHDVCEASPGLQWTGVLQTSHKHRHVPMRACGCAGRRVMLAELGDWGGGRFILAMFMMRVNIRTP